MGQAGQRHPQDLDSTQGRHGGLQAVRGRVLATIAALELPEGHRIDTGCGSRGFTVGCPLYEQ